MMTVWFFSALVALGAPTATAPAPTTAPVTGVGVELTADIDPHHGLPGIPPLAKLTITNRTKSAISLASGVRVEATPRGGAAVTVRCSASFATCGTWSKPWFQGTPEGTAISLAPGASRSMYLDIEHSPLGLDPVLLQPGDFTLVFTSADLPAVASNPVPYTVDPPTGDDLIVWRALTPAGGVGGVDDALPFLRDDIGRVLHEHPASTYAKAWGFWTDLMSGVAAGENLTPSAERWIDAGVPEPIDVFLRLNVAEAYRVKVEELVRRGEMDQAQVKADKGRALLLALQKTGGAYAADAASAILARGIWTPSELNRYRDKILGAGRTPLKAIDPRVDCVTMHPDGTFTAWFGYVNRNDGIYSVPIGAGNRFLTPPDGRGQPTAFLMGDHPNAFSVTSPRAEQAVWLLEGKRAVASANEGAARCNK